MSSSPSFFAELQRRHVYKVGAAYAVGGWLLVQVVTQVFPIFDISALVQRVIVLAIVAGFPIALVLAWLFDITPEGLVLTEPADPQTQDAPGVVRARLGTDRRLNWILGVGLLLSAGYLAVEHTVLDPARTVANPGPGANAMAIAVLPFENLSDDKANAYFAVGIQDEILTRLSRIGALRVISRTSTQRYASRPDNLLEIAKQLGVTSLLEGSVQKAGEVVLVNVRLIQASTGDQLWAESYDRRLDDIFGVEREVAEAVARQLDAKLSGAEQRALDRKVTDSAQAYDFYLQGIALDAAYDQSLEHLQAVAAAYGRATVADPGFAEAWSRLAIARLVLYLEYEHTPAQLALAKAAVDSALRAQPDLPEAWVALGNYREWGLSDYEGAIQAYEHAQLQMPNQPTLMQLIAELKGRNQHWDQAVPNLRKAAELDPRNPKVWINLGSELEGLRRFDEAKSAYAKALELQPGSAALAARIAVVDLQKGDLAAAANTLSTIHLDALQYSTGVAFTGLWRQRRDYAAGIAEWTRALVGEDRMAIPDVAPSHINRGDLERCAGQREAALADYATARRLLEALRSSGDTSPYAGMFLGPLNAALGDGETGLKLSSQAMVSFADDPDQLSAARVELAKTQMLAGDAAAAIHSLETSLHESSGLTIAQLRNDCLWDGLRGDKGFQALLNPTP